MKRALGRGQLVLRNTPTRFSGDENSSKSPCTHCTSAVRFFKYSRNDCGVDDTRGIVTCSQAASASLHGSPWLESC